MPWEETEPGTNSPLLNSDSPTYYNDQHHKPVRRNRIKKQSISSIISSLAMPPYSPNTKRCIKSLTSDDGNNNLGKSDSTPQKRNGNHEDLSAASRRKLNKDRAAFGDSDIENLVNETPTKGKLYIVYRVSCAVYLFKFNNPTYNTILHLLMLYY